MAIEYCWCNRKLAAWKGEFHCLKTRSSDTHRRLVSCCRLPDFLYGEIEALYKIFKSPLENAGHKENVSTISEQLNAMIKYALQYLDVSKTEYRVA